MMIRQWLQVAVLLTVLVAASGCASIASLKEDPRTGKADHAKEIYGGVREEWDTMTSSWRGPSWSKAISVVSAVDLPLCAVVDTVALPFTIPYNVIRGSNETNTANQASQAIVQKGSVP
jgi:uncharacterized protein YceK